MAKNKGKISAAQRDKNAIARASILKRAGIISKSAKLHSGHYISKVVLKKVKQYEGAANLGYRAVKVNKATAKAAQERGFQVVGGNRIIGPATPTFRNRLKKGQLTGVHPVKGGMMEEVVLPHTVVDMASLVDQLEGGIDTLKLPEEQFAFKIGGNESFRAFMNTDQMLSWLRNYKGIFDPSSSVKPEDQQEIFEEFRIFRMHPDSVSLNIRGERQRREDRKRRKAEAIANGTYVSARRGSGGRTWAEKVSELPSNRVVKMRQKAAQATAERRAKMSVAERQAERVRNKERMKRARDLGKKNEQQFLRE